MRNVLGIMIASLLEETAEQKDGKQRDAADSNVGITGFIIAVWWGIYFMFANKQNPIGLPVYALPASPNLLLRLRRIFISPSACVQLPLRMLQHMR